MFCKRRPAKPRLSTSLRLPCGWSVGGGDDGQDKSVWGGRSSSDAICGTEIGAVKEKRGTATTAHDAAA
jgi:hypothetical protein